MRESEEAVERLLDRAVQLGAKLGPVLLQLPPPLAADPALLERALRCFPPSVRVAVEFRHPSWSTDEVRALLTELGAALCLADSPRRTTPLWRTADWGYLRLHEGRASPHPCYGRQALASWADRLAELWPDPAELFVYFNNDPAGCAVRDARWFAAAAARRGLDPTRVPAASEIRVG